MTRLSDLDRMVRDRVRDQPAPFDWSALDVPIKCDVDGCDDLGAWIVRWVTLVFPCGRCVAAEIICHAHFVRVTLSIQVGGPTICNCREVVGLTRDLVTRIEPL